MTEPSKGNIPPGYDLKVHHAGPVGATTPTAGRRLSIPSSLGAPTAPKDLTETAQKLTANEHVNTVLNNAANSIIKASKDKNVFSRALAHIDAAAVKSGNPVVGFGEVLGGTSCALTLGAFKAARIARVGMEMAAEANPFGVLGFFGGVAATIGLGIAAGIVGGLGAIAVKIGSWDKDRSLHLNPLNILKDELADTRVYLGEKPSAKQLKEAARKEAAEEPITPKVQKEEIQAAKVAIKKYFKDHNEIREISYSEIRELCGAHFIGDLFKKNPIDVDRVINDLINEGALKERKKEGGFVYSVHSPGELEALHTQPRMPRTKIPVSNKGDEKAAAASGPKTVRAEHEEKLTASELQRKEKSKPPVANAPKKPSKIPETDRKIEIEYTAKSAPGGVEGEEKVKAAAPHPLKKDQRQGAFKLDPEAILKIFSKSKTTEFTPEMIAKKLGVTTEQAATQLNRLFEQGKISLTSTETKTYLYLRPREDLDKLL